MLNRLKGWTRSFGKPGLRNNRRKNGAGRGTKSWIASPDNRYFLAPLCRRPAGGVPKLSPDAFQLRYVKRQRTELPAVHRQIDRVFAKLREANLLDHHDEMGGHRPQPRMKFHL
jgi:hypothetical protein